MLKSNILFVGVLFSIILAASISPSYAEYTSPKKQMELGVLPEDVICRDGKVLVIRDNGKVACVHDSTAEKLEWNVINTVFEVVVEESKNTDLEALSIDLSGITLKSDVLEGNYKTGLFTESQQGLMRGPAPIPFVNPNKYVVTQDGSVDFSKMDKSAISSVKQSLSRSFESKIKTPDEYLKYFPEYIPDGQELKFFTFMGRENYTSLYLAYAPIVISVDPYTLTQEELADIGGIQLTIVNDPDILINKSNNYKIYRERGFIIDSENYVPNTVVHTLISDNPGGLVTWIIDDGTFFQIDSSSYNTTELLKMAEKALN